MRALIFDFDGVIVDSEPIHEEGLRRALSPLGIAVREGISIGLSDEDALSLIAGEAGVEVPGEVRRRVLAEKGRFVERALERGEARAYPGTIELIREAAAVMPIAVCSAAFRREIVPVLGALGVAELFRTVVSIDDVPAAKPDPAGYLMAAARLGIGAAECVAIEDSPRGVSAAVSAGMTAVAVGHTTARERLAHAHHVEERIAGLNLARLRAIHGARRG